MEKPDVCRVIRVRAAEGGARLLVDVEYGKEGETVRETLAVLTSRLSREIRVGEITEAECETLRAESAYAGAMGTALRILSAGGCSARRLCEKLRQRDIPAALAGEVVKDVAARGYLNESEGALREAERGVAKYWGDRRILSDLLAKGYSEASLAGVREFLAGKDAVARCAELMRRRGMRAPDDETEARKLFSSLERYGYSLREIRDALVTRR